jgi:hypothetical protein
MWRLVEVLEATMDSSQIQTIVPKEKEMVASLVLEASSQIRALLDRPKD